MFRKAPDWVGNEYVVIIGVAMAIALIGTLAILGTGGNFTTRRVANPSRLPMSNNSGSTPNVTARDRHVPSSDTFPNMARQADPIAAPSVEPPIAVLSPAPSDSAPASSLVERAPGSENNSDPFPGERFPQTRLIALAESDVSSWPAADVQYAINEIFARHGAEFPNKQVSANFAQFAWYHPQPGASFDQIETALPTVERSNVQALGSVRNKKRNGSQTNFVQQTVPQETVQMTQPLQNIQPDYPTAQWSLFNGCVFSPYPPNNLIRVDNVAPGSLVTDPTTNGVFRTPLQPPDPQSFPIAQWSNIPGNVISPYPPNNLLNVANIPPGTLRVDLTTNGVFRTPYEPGPSVDPTQIMGGLLNGISQAIQSNNHRRRRP